MLKQPGLYSSLCESFSGFSQTLLKIDYAANMPHTILRLFEGINVGKFAYVFFISPFFILIKTNKYNRKEDLKTELCNFNEAIVLRNSPHRT
jgi:hypothetical protein